MARAKTRVVAEYNGTPKQLFSILERSDQSLVIIPTHDEFMMNEKQEREPCIEEHISVHLSPNSAQKGTTIKRTVVFAGGKQYTSAQFVYDSHSSMRAHIMTKLSPELTAKYDAKPRAKDAVATVTKFGKIDQATLIYSIFVSDLAADMPDNEHNTVTTIRFSKLKVTVYVSLLNVVAATFSCAAISMTNSERVDGVPQRDLTSSGRPSLEATEIPDLIYRMEFECARAVMHRWARQEPDSAAAFENHPLWFHPTPSDLALGRSQRGH